MTFRARIVFFALLATFPIQLGKHFWPYFSFVQGIRVDYLSPTLYLSDILLFLLLIVSPITLKKDFLKWISHSLPFWTLSTILVGALLAQEKAGALYGILKFVEFSYLGYFIYKSVRRNDLDDISFVFVLWGIVETIIAMFQIFAQRSLGGPFYYLGERTFDASTPGIAAFHFNYTLIMRPYGTFPHPNVLAFYLLCSLVFLLVIKGNIPFKTILQYIVGLILLLGIFLTFSRIVLILGLFAAFAFILKRTSKHTSYPIIVGTILAAGVLFILRGKSEFITDFFLRLQLIKIGVLVFVKNILFGVGLNNFFIHEIFFQKNVTPILLQPIHNIYFMWIVQTGLAGLIIGTFFIKTVINTLSPRPFACFLLLSAAICGIFDHYFITLQQGILLFVFLIGIYFNPRLRSGSR